MEETVWAAERNDYYRRASAEHGSACFNVSNQIQFAAFCGVDGLYILCERLRKLTFYRQVDMKRMGVGSCIVSQVLLFVVVHMSNFTAF